MKMTQFTVIFTDLKEYMNALNILEEQTYCTIQYDVTQRPADFVGGKPSWVVEVRPYFNHEADLSGIFADLSCAP